MVSAHPTAKEGRHRNEVVGKKVGVGAVGGAWSVQHWKENFGRKAGHTLVDYPANVRTNIHTKNVVYT